MSQHQSGYFILPRDADLASTAERIEAALHDTLECEPASVDTWRRGYFQSRVQRESGRCSPWAFLRFMDGCCVEFDFGHFRIFIISHERHHRTAVPVDPRDVSDATADDILRYIAQAFAATGDPLADPSLGVTPVLK